MIGAVLTWGGWVVVGCGGLALLAVVLGLAVLDNHRDTKGDPPVTQAEARARIVEAARKHRQRRIARDAAPFLPPALSARHLQQCVCIVRRNRLVKPEVLIAAGFNPGRGAR